MIGMYWAMTKQWFASVLQRRQRHSGRRSGTTAGLILCLLIVGLSAAYIEHGRGNLHKLKTKIEPDRQDVLVPRPGGQDAIELTRTQFMGGSMPEFLSVTMLPGRGMNILQITAYIPGRGEVKLLASPSVEEAASAMTGADADASGLASLTMGGAFEVPWAGRMDGAASQAGRMNASWRGHPISLPAANGAGGGLLLAAPSDTATTAALPDGGQAQAVYHLEDFGARWPSKTDVMVTVMLGSRWIEMSVVAHNVGTVAEPIGIGWAPRFAILGGQREQMRLRVSGTMREELHDRQSGMPTGRLLPVNGTSYDYTAHDGVELGASDLDECFTALHRELLDAGPVAELRDTANGFGLRLTALNSTIQAMRVVAPAGAKYVSIEPQYNLDDPFGSEWKTESDAGMVVLQPGKTTEWKTRLELFSLGDRSPARPPIM